MVWSPPPLSLSRPLPPAGVDFVENPTPPGTQPTRTDGASWEKDGGAGGGGKGPSASSSSPFSLLLSEGKRVASSIKWKEEEPCGPSQKRVLGQIKRESKMMQGNSQISRHLVKILLRVRLRYRDSLFFSNLALEFEFCLFFFSLSQKQKNDGQSEEEEEERVEEGLFAHPDPLSALNKKSLAKMLKLARADKKNRKEKHRKDNYAFRNKSSRCFKDGKLR